jgi:cell division protein FtsQ
MLALKDNRKIKILFYIFVLLSLSTINFFKLDNTINKQTFFSINKIEITGTNKIDKNKILKKLDFLYGKNIFMYNRIEIDNVLNRNNLIKEFKITKYYPNKIKIELKEPIFVALIVKKQKKFFLTDNQKLILFNEKFNEKMLPTIYGINGEKFFKDFYNKLNRNNFNLEMIKNYYFFQINRWDFILNNGLLIKLPTKELDEAIILAKKLIKDSNFKNIEIIDLRIKGRIITQ